LVVNRRLDIVTTYQPAHVVYLKDAAGNPVIEAGGRVAAVLATLDPCGIRRLLDLSGHLLPDDQQGLDVEFFSPTTPTTTLPATRRDTRTALRSDELPQVSQLTPSPTQPTPNPLGLGTSPILTAFAAGKVSAGDPPPPSAPDTLSIVYLPDFEEQMAIES